MTTLYHITRTDNDRFVCYVRAWGAHAAVHAARQVHGHLDLAAQAVADMPYNPNVKRRKTGIRRKSI